MTHEERTTQAMKMTLEELLFAYHWAMDTAENRKNTIDKMVDSKKVFDYQTSCSDAKPFTWCFTDVNGKPTELTDDPVHRHPQDLRVYTPLYTHPSSSDLQSALIGLASDIRNMHPKASKDGIAAHVLQLAKPEKDDE